MTPLTPLPTPPLPAGGFSRDDFYFASVSTLLCEESEGLPLNDDHWPSHHFKVTELGIIMREIEGIFTTTSLLNDIDSVAVFAAITRLMSASDYPNHATLLSGDAVANTTLTIPVPATTATIRKQWVVKLEPGWYSLTFGTHAFHAYFSSLELST